MRETVISIKDITKRFGDFTAVNNMSFDVYKGEIFGLVGESGSGKSTFGRVLLNLYPATSGEVIYYGNFEKMRKGKFLKFMSKTT